MRMTALASPIVSAWPKKRCGKSLDLHPFTANFALLELGVIDCEQILIPRRVCPEKSTCLMFPSTYVSCWRRTQLLEQAPALQEKERNEEEANNEIATWSAAGWPRRRARVRTERCGRTPASC